MGGSRQLRKGSERLNDIEKLASRSSHLGREGTKMKRNVPRRISFGDHSDDLGANTYHSGGSSSNTLKPDHKVR